MNDKDRLEAADATGMVGSEALLAQLHAALPESHEAHATIEDFGKEMRKPTPSRAAIEGHVGSLRSVRELEAIVVNWWDSPPVQRIIADLTQIGL